MPFHPITYCVYNKPAIVRQRLSMLVLFVTYYITLTLTLTLTHARTHAHRYSNFLIFTNQQTL